MLRGGEGRAESGLIGRDHELGQLVELVRTLIDKRRGLPVLLRGPAGIGKTVLLRELVERLRRERDDVTPAEGVGFDDDGLPAYWLFQDLLRAMAARDGRVPVPSPGGSRPPNPFAVAAAVEAALRTGADRVHLVALDDLQWADEASLSLLEILGQRRPPGLVVVAAMRDRDHVPARVGQALRGFLRDATVVELAGLDRAAARSLLETELGEPVGSPMFENVHRRTRGNPLFLREYATAIARGVPLERVPHSVAPIFAIRLDRLDADARRLAQIASLFAADIAPELLESAAPGLGVERTQAAIAGLIDAHILVRSSRDRERLDFAHPMLREVVHAEVAPEDREEIHVALASALADSDDADVNERAWHLSRAGDRIAPEQVARACLAGGRRALASYSFERAVGMLERGLKAADQLRPDDAELRARLLTELAEAKRGMRRPKEARALAVRAFEVARALSPELAALAALAYPFELSESIGRITSPDPVGLELRSDALDRIPDGELPALAVRLRARQERSRGAGPGVMVPLVDEARDAGDDEALVEVLRLTKWADPDNIPHYLDEIARVAQRTQDPDDLLMAYIESMPPAIEQGNRAELDALLALAMPLVESVHHPQREWQIELMRAVLELIDGNLEGAEARSLRAFTIAQHTDPATAVQAYTGQIALIRREQDQFADVVPSFIAQATMEPDVPVWQSSRAWVLALSGDLDSARELLPELSRMEWDRLSADGFSGATLATLGETAILCDDEASAERIDALLARRAGRNLIVTGALFFGPADRLRAGIAYLRGKTSDAEAGFEAALALCRRFRTPLWLAHTIIDVLERPDLFGAADRQALASELDELFPTHAMPPLLARRRRVLPEALAAPPVRTAPRICELRRVGRGWSMDSWAGSVQLGDLKGVGYLAELLRRPWQGVHVADLTRSEVRPSRDVVGADEQALAEYRAARDDLRARIAGAKGRNDWATVTALERELAFVERELLSHYPAKGDPQAERMRKAVSNRIRDVIKRIEEAAPRLGTHLRNSVRTGMTCEYAPESRVEWIVFD